ncbi:MAG: hypothetical protein WBN57_02885 [Gammaproteobacteria bacterium]
MSIIKVTIMCAEREELPCCRDLLDGCPEISILARANGLNEAGVWLALERSDILILDEAVIHQHGIDEIRGLHQSEPSIRSLLIMENSNENNIISMLSLGVSGVISRSSLASYLCRALAAIHSGEIWVSRQLVAPLRDELVYTERQVHWSGHSAGHSRHDKLN